MRKEKGKRKKKRKKEKEKGKKKRRKKKREKRKSFVCEGKRCQVVIVLVQRESNYHQQ